MNSRRDEVGLVPYTVTRADMEVRAHGSRNVYKTLSAAMAMYWRPSMA